MNRISHATYSTIFGIVYLGLMTNLMVLIASLPLVILLVTTDPVRSWPLLAIATPLCAPALSAAFTVFREHARGGTEVARQFLVGWRATWRRAMALGAMVTAVFVVVLVDVRFFANSTLSVAFVPALGMVGVIAFAVGIYGLVALSEAPTAGLREIVRASAFFALRRWYITAVSLLVLVLQVALFTTLPAIAIGMTASAALYLTWANSRFALRPVLDLNEVTAVAAATGSRN